jgi:hypothetical protein
MHAPPAKHIYAGYPLCGGAPTKTSPLERKHQLKNPSCKAGQHILVEEYGTALLTNSGHENLVPVLESKKPTWAPSEGNPRKLTELSCQLKSWRLSWALVKVLCFG